MNLVQLMGRLGADAETRFTPGGQKVTNLRLACNVRKGQEEDTIWYRVTLWGDRWDKILPYMTKGSALVVTGELRKPEIYTDRNGNPAVSMEVWADNVRFSPFGRSQDQQNEQGGMATAPATPAAAPAAPAMGTAPAAPTNDPWAQAAPQTQTGTASTVAYGTPAFGETGSAPAGFGSQSVSEDDVPF